MGKIQSLVPSHTVIYGKVLVKVLKSLASSNLLCHERTLWFGVVPPDLTETCSCSRIPGLGWKPLLGHFHPIFCFPHFPEIACVILRSLYSSPPCVLSLSLTPTHTHPVLCNTAAISHSDYWVLQMRLVQNETWFRYKTHARLWIYKWSGDPDIFPFTKT